MEIIGLIATIAACTGVWLNNRKRRACFYLFLVSNSLSLAIHVHAGLLQGADVKAMILRDAVFVGLAVEGLWLWRKP